MAARSAAAKPARSRRRESPVDRALRTAPVGPPLDARERRALDAARSDIEHGRVRTLAEVKKRLGL